ncbi:MAG: hypothetical protein Q4C37_01430 [Bacteroidales bacterium]|nr:hypothetical protein [Bacteroidales bacterium]
MKKLKILFVVLLGCFSFSAIVAADPSSQGTSMDNPPKQSSKTTQLHLKRASNRPNSPSRVGIECVYGEGFIEFSLPESVFSLSVTISNDTEEWYGFVTRYDFIQELPIGLSGEYSVECTAEDGRIYIGSIVY